MTRREKITTLLVSVLIVAGGLVTAGILLKTAPTTEPEDKASGNKVVQVMDIQPGELDVTITAYGPVIPARQVVIQPQVGGRIVEQHPSLVPGGFLNKGEELVRIDPSDYELRLIEMEAALQEARFQLEVERGRQVVAEREWTLLQNDLPETDVNKALVLRQPHLKLAEARIQSATNEIAKAKLALTRTRVQAPFNAMVLNESVEVGQLMDSGDNVATLVGTDEAWIQATLPLGELARIKMPDGDQPGASATVTLDLGRGNEARWQGHVTHVLSDLDGDARMARVLVTIKDPFGLETRDSPAPLLIGSFVRIDIEAGRLTDAIELPRRSIREGGRIWIADRDNLLRIREIQILWTNPETVLVDNVLEEGDRVIVSGLRNALPETKLDPVTVEP